MAQTRPAAADRDIRRSPSRAPVCGSVCRNASHDGARVAYRSNSTSAPGVVRSVADGLDILEIDSLALLEQRFAALARLLAAAGGGHEHAAGFALPAPEEITGSLLVLLAAGAFPLTRAFMTIWINQQTGSAVRATVHSMHAQAKYLGEIVCGLAVAAP